MLTVIVMVVALVLQFTLVAKGSGGPIWGVVLLLWIALILHAHGL